MKMTRFALLAAAAAAMLPAAAHAAVTMTANYYTLGETDADANRFPIQSYSNEVQTLLGPDGLPVLNTAAYGCTSNCYTGTVPLDVNSKGEITYWSPSLNNGGPGKTSDVVLTGTGTISLPYSNQVFFPPNGSGSADTAGFQTATFTTTLTVPTAESISFSVGADDDAFVYLDGSVVCDLGGVHADVPGACTSAVLSAGTHSLQLFYADLENVNAALTFAITTANVTSGGTPVPEPATLTLLGVALAGLGFVRRRRAA